MQQLLLITCLGVGIPILIIVGIIVFLLINRRRSQQHREDNNVVRENEENEVTNNKTHKTKCIDTHTNNSDQPNISNIATLTHKNENLDSVRNSQHTKNDNRYYQKPENNVKNINEVLEQQNSRTLSVLFESQRKQASSQASSSKDVDSETPAHAAGNFYAESSDSSVVDDR